VEKKKKSKDKAGTKGKKAVQAHPGDALAKKEKKKIAPVEGKKSAPRGAKA
jgi:hypothetical protein